MTLSDGMEMFFVRPRPGDEDTARDQIATFAATLGGVVLMTTDGGALVLGMPLGCKDALAAHGSVAFVGGVSFGDGPGVEALQQRFALNAARQLAARGQTWLSRPVASPPAAIGRAPWLPTAAPADAHPAAVSGRASLPPIRQHIAAQQPNTAPSRNTAP